MKKTTYFRIELSEDATSLCDSIVMLAAKANGGRSISLKDLETVAKGEAIRFPSINEGATVELIGDTLLHIDKKVKDKYQTVCRIQEVEILEISETENDIPEELFQQTQTKKPCY